MRFTTYIILLIRHGKPDIWLLPEGQKKILSKEMGIFLSQYDLAGIEKNCILNEKKINSLQQINYVFTSEMKRAEDTFQCSETNVAAVSNYLFNEVGLPSLNLPLLKLKPKCWMTILRILWFLGYSKQCETKKQIKKRATLATEFLFNEATKNGNIALFGHGVFNYFLKKELLKRGGRTLNKWEYGYWAYNEIAIVISKTPNE